MVKGVSQKVIEVVHTDNRYFEKAILFLRPTAQAEDRGRLREYAGDYLTGIDYNPTQEEKKGFHLSEWLKMALAGLGGAAIACLCFLL